METSYFASPAPPNRVSPLTTPTAIVIEELEDCWDEDLDASKLVEAARKAVYPFEFRVREELDLLSRQWPSILGSLFVLIYLVLMVFLNLAFYRYQPPADGRRLKDLGFEIIPQLPSQYEPIVDLPLWLMYVYAAVLLLGTFRAFFPCKRGVYKDKVQEIPYLVNMVRRFLLTYAAGHVFRALTYLVTQIPGGNDKCLDADLYERRRPTLAQAFYRTASVTENCGDLMFSGHLLLCTLLICLANRYIAQVMSWGNRGRQIFVGIGIFLTFWEFIMIIASRHHYTSDCIVSFYFTPTLWYCFEYYNPHDQVPDRVHIARSIVDSKSIRIKGLTVSEVVPFVV